MNEDLQHHSPVPRSVYRKMKRLLVDLGAEIRRIDRAFGIPGPEPKGARASRLWITYILIHLADFSESAAQLTDEKYSRALAVLSRTTYEYLISMIYLYRHPDIADEQLLTQGARFFKLGMSARIPDGSQSEERYAAAYSAWLADASGSGLNEFTGNFKFLKAALEIEGETKERCPLYSVRYGVMSTVAHPDAAGFPDVFLIDNETHTVTVGLQSSLHAFDLLFAIGADLVRAMQFLQTEVNVNVSNLTLFKRRLDNVAGEHFDLAK